MRIIGGMHSGRKFYPPAKISARPTTDMAKEGLFNTLHNFLDFEGLKTLDIFAGTGSISYELASRGAVDITVIEQDRKALNFIREEARVLHFENSFKAVAMDAFQFLSSCREQYDFIFADPPYGLKGIDRLPQLIFERELLTPGGIFVLEHSSKQAYEHLPFFMKEKSYGAARFSFFEWVQ